MAKPTPDPCPILQGPSSIPPDGSSQNMASPAVRDGVPTASCWQPCARTACGSVPFHSAARGLCACAHSSAAGPSARAPIQGAFVVGVPPAYLTHFGEDLDPLSSTKLDIATLLLERGDRPLSIAQLPDGSTTTHLPFTIRCLDRVWSMVDASALFATCWGSAGPRWTISEWQIRISTLSKKPGLRPT